MSLNKEEFRKVIEDTRVDALNYFREFDSINQLKNELNRQYGYAYRVGDKGVAEAIGRIEALVEIINRKVTGS